MTINLNSVGMEKGRQYETIITTKNPDGSKNAAPIGVICAEFIVNITHDPELFTFSLLGNLPQTYFNDDYSLKCGDAHFKCRAIKFTEAVKQSDPIKKKDEAIVIKSEVTDMTINKPAKAMNRGFGYVIETLTNLTRFDLVDEAQKEKYIARFKEANRVVLKVGRKEDIKAMQEIKKELLKKGYDL